MRTRGIAVAAAAAALALAPAALAAAGPGGGYGPAAPTGPAGTPGGFTSVVTTQTVGAPAGALAAQVTGARVNAVVPTGAFSKPVQLEVTQPKLADVAPALPKVGYAGYQAVSGLGFKVLNTDGTPLTGTFAKPVDITLSGPGLGVPGEKVLRFDGPASASVVDATVGNGSITIHLTEDPNLVVVNPTTTTQAAGGGAVVPGATTKHTGKPFAGETVVAGGLLLAGAGSLFAARRRKATA